MTPEEQATADAAAATKATADAKAAADTAAAAKAAVDTKAAADKAAADLKAAGGAADDGKAKGDKVTPKAPAEYALTVPDGAAELVSTADLDYIKELAKTGDWTNEEAQDELKAIVDRAKANITAKSNAWAADTKKDAEIGGEHLDVTQRQVKAVIDRFLPDSEGDGKLLRQAMNAGGYGNYRPLVKLLARIGKAMAEDSPAFGKSGGGDKTVEDTLYDHPSSKAS